MCKIEKRREREKKREDRKAIGSEKIKLGRRAEALEERLETGRAGGPARFSGSWHIGRFARDLHDYL